MCERLPPVFRQCPDADYYGDHATAEDQTDCHLLGTPTFRLWISDSQFWETSMPNYELDYKLDFEGPVDIIKELGERGESHWKELHEEILAAQAAREEERNAAAEGAKMTNPKQLVGDTKCPLALVPDTISAEVAMAFLEGALKYGRFNWRVMGVRASTYKSAAERHLAKWWNGEDRDPKTHVKHLASAMACLGILLDAAVCDQLNDDRPPAAPLGELFDEQRRTIEHLRDLFKDCNPRQWTIDDDIPSKEAS